MNNIFLSFSGFLLAILFLRESSCSQSTESGSDVIPLKKGNVWIYRDSIIENGKLTSVSLDTLRIESTATFEGVTTYLFNDGKELMVKGDTIFQLVTQRGGYKFPTKLFFASEEEATFNYAFGGDVMIQRTVSSIPCTANDFKVSKCYRISDGCRGETILGAGVGILREIITDCKSTHDYYSSRTLIATRFQK